MFYSNAAFVHFSGAAIFEDNVHVGLALQVWRSSVIRSLDELLACMTLSRGCYSNRRTASNGSRNLDHHSCCLST